MQNKQKKPVVFIHSAVPPPGLSSYLTMSIIHPVAEFECFYLKKPKELKICCVYAQHHRSRSIKPAHRTHSSC